MLPSPDEAIEISVSDLQELRDSHSGTFRLIDCREEDEWHLCRIEDAELVPLSAVAEKALQWDATAGEKFIVYCHHGMRSLKAAQFLRAKGFEHCFSLAGGIEAWSTEIDPGVARY